MTGPRPVAHSTPMTGAMNVATRAIMPTTVIDIAVDAGAGPDLGLIHDMEGGDTLAHAVEAGAEDLDLSPHADQDHFLQGDLDQHLKDPGLDQDQDLDPGPDRFRAQGGGLALWQDQSLVLKPGASQNLDHHLQSEAAHHQEVPAGVKLPKEMTKLFIKPNLFGRNMYLFTLL